jgi:hypothetical protein
MFNGGPNATSPAFLLPDSTNAGTASRNLVRGFGDFQVNLAIQRELRFPYHLDLQLRGEAFNIFNHPDFGYVDPVINDALFGQAILTLNQSFGSGGPLYQPGGPRCLQGSIRLHF